jgi:hypothetical protein
MACNERLALSCAPSLPICEQKQTMAKESSHGFQHWPIRCLALGLGFILVRSAMFHVENNYAFLLSLDSYKLVPLTAAVPAAALVPYFQLTVGVMLLFFPKSWLSAFGWCAGLFLVFTGAQVIDYARGLNIACGCFSPSDDNPIGIRSIGLAAVATVAAIAGTVLTARQRGSGPCDQFAESTATMPALP